MTGRKGPSEGRTDILIQLLDYTVQTFFPEVMTLTVELYLFFVIKVFFFQSAHTGLEQYSKCLSCVKCRSSMVSSLLCQSSSVVITGSMFIVALFSSSPPVPLSSSLLSLFLFCSSHHQWLRLFSSLTLSRLSRRVERRHIWHSLKK